MKKILLSSGEVVCLTMEECVEFYKNYLKYLTKSWIKLTPAIAGDYEDLYSIAVLGLINAYNSYDIEKNISFSSYISSVVNNTYRQFYRKNINGYMLEKVKMSLDEEFYCNGEDDSLSYEDIITDEDSYEQYEKIEKKILINEMLKKLNKEERELIKLYYFQKKSQPEIAKLMNTYQTKISRKLNKIHKKLRGIYNELSNDDWKANKRCRNKVSS